MLGHPFPCPWQYRASSWRGTQHDTPAVIWSCRHRLRIVHSSWQWLFFDSLALPPDDRSSETVWRGDDRSSDRHLFSLIDHRKRFDGEMIALMTGTYFRWSIIGKINRFAVHKSDHLPVKTFPMIDHLTAKLFPMIDHLTVKPFPMIDHRNAK